MGIKFLIQAYFSKCAQYAVRQCGGWHSGVKGSQASDCNKKSASWGILPIQHQNGSGSVCCTQVSAGMTCFGAVSNPETAFPQVEKLRLEHDVVFKDADKNKVLAFSRSVRCLVLTCLILNVMECDVWR
eukprot:2372132-Rhodomonas_salina.1